MKIESSLFRSKVLSGLSLVNDASAQTLSSALRGFNVSTGFAAVVDPDQGKMGMYRSLAQLAYIAYLERRDTQAAVLARILEKVWDRSEADLHRSSPEAWERIYKSMDCFTKPLIETSSFGRLHVDVVTTACEQYLADLATAD